MPATAKTPLLIDLVLGRMLEIRTGARSPQINSMHRMAVETVVGGQAIVQDVRIDDGNPVALHADHVRDSSELLKCADEESQHE